MKNSAGFTLVEILLVIALISILAGVIFVALDPLTRFQDSRDVNRWSDVSAISEAIAIDQSDNGGDLLNSIDSTTANDWYMIVNGSNMTSGCDDNNAYCDVNVSEDNNCVDLSGLIDEGYLGDMPVSESSGNVDWDDGSSSGDEGTGYVLKRTSEGNIIVQACESENTDSIKITR